jgi:hypothetical protein
MDTHLRGRPSFVRTFEMIETEALRRRMEAAIETMIAALDALDGDTDSEPATDDEPSLGWLPDCSTLKAYGVGDDREQGDDEEPLFEDDEATSLERHGGSFVWSGADDDEDTHDAEYCVADQFGIADWDGVLEQGFCGNCGEGAL